MTTCPPFDSTSASCCRHACGDSPRRAPARAGQIRIGLLELDNALRRVLKHAARCL